MGESHTDLDPRDVVDADLQNRLRVILKRYDRIAITGGPRMGKSFLSKLVTDRDVIGTHDYTGVPIPDIPAAIIAEVSDRARFVVEGVWVPRALRKGLAIDAVIYMTKPKVPRSPGQVSMAKGVLTVFRDWRLFNQHVPLFIE